MTEACRKMGRLRQKWPFLTEAGCFWGRLRHFRQLRKPLMANAFPPRLIAPERLVERAAGRKGLFCPWRRLFPIAAGRKGLFCPRRWLLLIVAGRKGLFCPRRWLFLIAAGRKGLFCPRRRLFPIAAGRKGLFCPRRGATVESGEQKGAFMRAVEGNGYNGGGK